MSNRRVQIELNLDNEQISDHAEDGTGFRLGEGMLARRAVLVIDEARGSGDDVLADVRARDRRALK